MDTVIIAGTGHRPPKLKGSYQSYGLWDENIVSYENVLLKILKKYIDKGLKIHIISGMAMGWDTILFKVGVKLQNTYGIDKVSLEGAIPCTNQDIKWKKRDQKRYNLMMKTLDKKGNKKTFISTHDFSWKYGNQMQERNKYMVDNCDVLIACYDGTQGGTQNCIDYAKEKSSCNIINIHPETLKIEKISRMSTLF